MARARSDVHGTQGGYNNHRNNGEEPCASCRAGHNAYVAAQASAARVVAKSYPQEYREAFERELERRMAELMRRLRDES